MTFQTPDVSAEFYLASSPVLALSLSALIHLLLSVRKKGEPSPQLFIVLTHLTFLVSIVLALVSNQFFSFQRFLSGTYLMGHYESFAQLLILSIAWVSSCFMQASCYREKFYRGEITSLYFMLVAGMLVMVSSHDLISIFVGLELASIGIYALVGYIDPHRKSQEAAIKYFILGSFASGFTLMGMALIYATTGSLDIPLILNQLAEQTQGFAAASLGCLLLMAGLAFKLALVPFHQWAPDVYEAAPTPLTGFMATAVKVMTIITLLRFIGPGLKDYFDSWGGLFFFAATASVLVGNILALVQSSLKRMLAYSSIAHAGYMAVALVALKANGVHLPLAAILSYLIVYSIASLGIFGVLVSLENPDNTNIQLDDLAGIASDYPQTAFALSVFIVALAGIPPTAGFIAKFFVFSAAIEQQLYSLVVISLLGSVISLYYYLRVLVKMYFEPRSLITQLIAPSGSKLIGSLVLVAIVLTIVLGTFHAKPLYHIALRASASIAQAHH